MTIEDELRRVAADCRRKEDEARSMFDIERREFYVGYGMGIELALKLLKDEQEVCEHKWRNYEQIGVICRDCGTAAPEEVAETITRIRKRGV